MDSYKIIITPDAEDDLVELRNYIADVLLARDTARNYVRTIRKEIEAAEVHNVITCGLDHLAEGHTADVVITDGAADLHGLPG